MNVTEVIIDIHFFVRANTILQVSTKMLMSTKPTTWEKFLPVGQLPRSHEVGH